MCPAWTKTPRRNRRQQGDGDIPDLLAKGDGAGDARVPAPATWVCSELAFRRALRWVESPEYGRRSLLHDSIAGGLTGSTCHDPCRGRLRALRGTVPGPRSHCIPMCRAPGPHRPRHVPFGEQIGNGVPWVARRRGVASMPTLFSCSSHTVGQHTRLPVSAHGLAMSVGRPAYVPAMRLAGRVRYLARHEAGPCVSDGEC